MRTPVTRIALLACFAAGLPAQANLDALNHNRSLVDAHNCYPYEGKWTNRIDRALSAGSPVAIEQDLAWYVDPATNKGRVVVSHSAKVTGAEPQLRDYFFERVRPIVEAALNSSDHSRWPVLVLHFDFKDVQPDLLHAVWALLGEYRDWLTTAPKTADAASLQPLDIRPILVVTEDSDAQAKVFYDDLAVGDQLLLFGSAHARPVTGSTAAERAHFAATTPPEQLLREKPTNYRRWWNNSWAVVEEGGQRRAGEWTAAANQRLRTLVDYAHAQGFWIRFYTLDGFTPAEDQGWDASYNFGSRAAVMDRWKAAIAAGVNFIASDQYEDLGNVIKAH